ncbi:hypothetical protein MNBD_GAMMA10-1650 [hydrothermal vent metagenome]|uniref:Uncharacterized protein n=1 Tax=hydrothermal vent metagenome TaxID=652676 RepID=A0A3B0Y406_9ZZZZ
MRKNELFINYFVILGPVIFSLISVTSMGFVRSMPQLTFISMMALFIIGFLLFLKAKLAVINQGAIFSFGMSRMKKTDKYMYISAYGCMLFGCFILLSFLTIGWGEVRISF